MASRSHTEMLLSKSTMTPTRPSPDVANDFTRLPWCPAPCTCNKVSLRHRTRTTAFLSHPVLSADYQENGLQPGRAMLDHVIAGCSTCSCTPLLRVLPLLQEGHEEYAAYHAQHTA